ncbi:MAG: hypothetical protein NTW21_15275 [Verrucomicrobia bacterium]|nr:hypothetical protein [Verrucomicrobiota bacterium]
MRPPSEVATAPAGGSREQEQGEAQGGTWGACVPRARVDSPADHLPGNPKAPAWSATPPASGEW